MKKLLILPVVLVLMSFVLIDNTTTNQEEIDVYLNVNGNLDEVSQKLLLESLSDLKIKSKKVIFHTLKGTEDAADYIVNVNVDNFSISPEVITFKETKKTVLNNYYNKYSDENRRAYAVQNKTENVNFYYIRDPEIHLPQVVTIVNTVKTKSSELDATIDVVKSNEIVSSYKINSDYKFEDSFVENSSRKILKKQKSFPDDNEMMVKAIEDFKPKFKRALKKTIINAEF